MTSFLRRSLLAVSLVSSLIATPSFARTWFIAADGSGDAPTIQAGVDAASPGDLVLVGPGVYTDTHPMLVDGVTKDVNVHMTKNLVLASRDGASVTKLMGTTNGIAIFAEGLGASAEIRGFEIETPETPWFCAGPGLVAGGPFPRPTGIQAASCACTIVENLIHGGTYGMFLSQSPAVVTNNDLNSAMFGIYCVRSNAVVSENRIMNCGGGISASESSANIVNNSLGQVGSYPEMCSGINFGGTAQVNVRGNIIENAGGYGIECGGGPGVVEGNTVKGCNYAVDAHDATVTVENNVLVGNNTAIAFQACAGCSMVQNTIANNNNGISLIYADALVERNMIAMGLRGIGVLYSNPQFVCNNVFGMSVSYYGGYPPQTGLNGNINVDPQFCGMPGSGNYSLQSDSPCAPGNHPNGVDCGQIGALGVGCGTVKTQPTSWGAIKAMYRN